MNEECRSPRSLGWDTRDARMGMLLFFVITGLLNFAAGFALAMMLGHGPRSAREAVSFVLGRPRASHKKG